MLFWSNPSISILSKLAALPSPEVESSDVNSGEIDTAGTFAQCECAPLGTSQSEPFHQLGLPSSL